MTEALAIKTGATYTVTDLVVGAARQESFEHSGSSLEGRVYVRHFLYISDISFRTPISDLQAGMCGAMTHGDDSWRVRITNVSPMMDSLEVRGLALVARRTEFLAAPPSPEPPGGIPEVEAQFYDL